MRAPDCLDSPVYEPDEEEEVSGHDSPNWSKLKSGIVLLSCTAFYSFIAGKNFFLYLKYEKRTRFLQINYINLNIFIF